MDKIGRLERFIRSFDSVAVAFSGGVDSSTLLALTNRLCKRVVGVTIATQATPRREIRDAKRIASEIDAKHEIIFLDMLRYESFVRNDEKRCYYCKRIMLEKLIKYSKERFYDVIFEGTNSDELKEHRPGFEAIKEFKDVYSPWAMFGFGRKEIEGIAKRIGFDFHKKPSQSCLATRILSSKITKEKLKRVDIAEEIVLETTGVKQVRVRDFNAFAIIEVGKDERRKLFDENVIDRISEKLKKIGYERVLIDADGYN